MSGAQLGFPAFWVEREREGLEVDNKYHHLDDEHKDEESCTALLGHAPPLPTTPCLGAERHQLKRRLGVRLGCMSERWCCVCCAMR